MMPCIESARHPQNVSYSAIDDELTRSSYHREAGDPPVAVVGKKHDPRRPTLSESDRKEAKLAMLLTRAFYCKDPEKPHPWDNPSALNPVISAEAEPEGTPTYKPPLYEECLPNTERPAVASGHGAMASVGIQAISQSMAGLSIGNTGWQSSGFGCGRRVWQCVRLTPIVQAPLGIYYQPFAGHYYPTPQLQVAVYRRRKHHFILGRNSGQWPGNQDYASPGCGRRVWQCVPLTPIVQAPLGIYYQPFAGHYYPMPQLHVAVHRMQFQNSGQWPGNQDDASH